MLRRVSPFTTLFWLIPYLFGVVRGSVWQGDNGAPYSFSYFAFLGATFVSSEILIRWYRYKVITEVRRSFEASRRQQDLTSSERE